MLPTWNALSTLTEGQREYRSTAQVDLSSIRTVERIRVTITRPSGARYDFGNQTIVGILRLFLRHKVTNENVHIRSHSIFREPRMYSRNRYLDHLTTLFPDTLWLGPVYSVENFIYR
jgi:hypothetical protein